MWVDMWFLEIWVLIFLYVSAIFPKTILSYTDDGDSWILQNLVPTFSFFFFWRNSSQWTKTSTFTGFLDHTQRRTTIGKTPLDEWSAPRRELQLTTHINHNRQISMSPAGFEPIILAGERPQTYALDRAATATMVPIYHTKILRMPQDPN